MLICVTLLPIRVLVAFIAHLRTDGRTGGRRTFILTKKCGSERTRKSLSGTADMQWTGFFTSLVHFCYLAPRGWWWVYIADV